MRVRRTEVPLPVELCLYVPVPSASIVLTVAEWIVAALLNIDDGLVVVRVGHLLGLVLKVGLVVGYLMLRTP